MQDGKLKIMMSGLGGCSKFEDAQRAACRCVGDSRLKTSRLGVLASFYKKHNPEKPSKELKALTRKAGSVEKFAKLLIKLVRKYPKSVKKIRDPQQAMFEDMMSKYGGGGGA